MWINSISLKCAALLGLALLFGETAHAQTIEQPNIVGAELFGRALIYSANYERYFKGRVGVGSGIAYWHFDGNTFIVPLYVSATPMGRTHSLYLSAGATFGVTNESFWGSSRNYSSGKVGTLTAGYQFRSRDGFIIRPVVTLFYNRSGAIGWPGVMIGHTF
jgi:hypothetical protein